MAKTMKFGQSKKNSKRKETYTPNQNSTCFQCGKQGNINDGCPYLQNKNGLKGKKNMIPKKAYISREDNEVSSSSDLDNE